MSQRQQIVTDHVPETGHVGFATDFAELSILGLFEGVPFQSSLHTALHDQFLEKEIWLRSNSADVKNYLTKQADAFLHIIFKKSWHFASYNTSMVMKQQLSYGSRPQFN